VQVLLEQDPSNIWLAFKRDVLLGHKACGAECLIQREVVGASPPQVGPVDPPVRPDGGMSERFRSARLHG
jgi:hypothetical protein